jgi:Recombination endonuclease VII/Homeodomain-like domain
MHVTSAREHVGPVTANERQQIIDLYRAGTKVVEICRATGRSRSSIYTVLNGEGIEHRNADGRRAGICEVCGTQVRYVPPSLRAKGIGRFCSSACMGKEKRLPSSKTADGATELECRLCVEMKPVDDFYPHSTIARGRQYWCKACTAQKRRERASVPTDPKVTRKYKLKSYGITQEDYDAMYERQNGCCAICGDAKERWEPGAGLKGRQRFLVVDHDHQTSRVRALLCWNCNCGLGHFRENPAIMHAAIRYIAVQKPRQAA